ncbi:hypothetical protein ABFV99_13500 [Cytobacillus horneckiae]|uniref:hypothetical protein n=1 Tax=Cytobacillus horneckiae TaxID=549687 RepID=UPI0034CDF187
MKIYRGNIGIDLSLDEFTSLLDDEEKIDELLNIIYALEMDEAMSYDSKDIEQFEEYLFQEMAEYKRRQHANDDIIKMERILAHLKKYGR